MPEAKMRPPQSWGHSVVETACPLDCPDACSLAVTVDSGRVVSINGSRTAPSTQGFICSKVRHFDRRIYSPLRIQHPAIRKGTKGRADFERVTWDEALDLVAAKMHAAADAHGAESILPFYYGGSNGLLTNELTDARLFRRFGASRLARTVCAAPTGAAAAALYGKMAGVAYEDYPQAKTIILWGVNPQATGIHLVPFLKTAQQQGARLIVIDPRRTPLARQADLHLPIRPGTDVVLALSMIRECFATGRAAGDFLRDHATGVEELRASAEPWTFPRAAEITGIREEDIRTAFQWYIDATPALGAGAQPQRRRVHDGDPRAACCGRQIRCPGRRVYAEQLRRVRHQVRDAGRLPRAGHAHDQHEPARARPHGAQ